MADQKYIKKNKINFGFIGTFGPWHGTEILAKAVKKVVQNNSNIHFVLIGEGKNKEILNIKTIIRIKQKIKMLELRYDLLKKWGKGDTQLELLKQKFDVIKNKMRKIEF